MRGFGSTEIESGMTCLQLGHVADSPTRSPSVDNRCAAASQSERHRAWRVVPQHAITFVFSNAKSSRQQTHTPSGATVNTLAGDGRVKPPSSASSSSSSDPSISQVVGVASGGGDCSGAAGAPRGPPRTTSRGRSASHAWQTVVPGAFTSVHRSQVHDVGDGGARAGGGGAVGAGAGGGGAVAACSLRSGCGGRAPGKRRQLRYRTAPSAYSSARSP